MRCQDASQFCTPSCPFVCDIGLLRNQVHTWCESVSGPTQGNKLCEICRQPYKGPYKDPPGKPAPVLTGPAAAALRGATLMPQSLVQLAMSHRSEVSTAAARIRKDTIGNL